MHQSFTTFKWLLNRPQTLPKKIMKSDKTETTKHLVVLHVLLLLKRCVLHVYLKDKKKCEEHSKFKFLLGVCVSM